MPPPLRVLVADDNAINLRVAVGLLENLGCVCDTAPDGIEAARLAMANEYVMIFMDVQMPRMDGLAATRAIRGHEARLNRPRTPIAGLTCLDQGEDRARGLAAGMDLYLAKPVHQAALIQALSNHARRPAPPATSPSAPAPDSTPVLDATIAARLRELPGGLAVELWLEFARDLPTRCTEITAAVAAGDAPAAHRLLHGLKGSAGTLGLTRLQRALTACDEAARLARPGWQTAWPACQQPADEARAACLAAAGH